MSHAAIHASDSPLNKWCNILLGSIGLITAIGLLMIIPPQPGVSYFNFILYGTPDFPDLMSDEGAQYASFLYALLACVMIGWMVPLAYLVHDPLRSGSRVAWNVIIFSIMGWFVIDSGVSLVFGYWQNALSNVSLALLVVLPLMLIRPHLNQGEG